MGQQVTRNEKIKQFKSSMVKKLAKKNAKKKKKTYSKDVVDVSASVSNTDLHSWSSSRSQSKIVNGDVDDDDVVEDIDKENQDVKKNEEEEVEPINLPILNDRKNVDNVVEDLGEEFKNEKLKEKEDDEVEPINPMLNAKEKVEPHIDHDHLSDYENDNDHDRVNHTNLIVDGDKAAIQCPNLKTEVTITATASSSSFVELEKALSINKKIEAEPKEDEKENNPQPNTASELNGDIVLSYEKTRNKKNLTIQKSRSLDCMLFGKEKVNKLEEDFLFHTRIGHKQEESIISTKYSTSSVHSDKNYNKKINQIDQDYKLLEATFSKHSAKKREMCMEFENDGASFMVKNEERNDVDKKKDGTYLLESLKTPVDHISIVCTEIDREISFLANMIESTINVNEVFEENQEILGPNMEKEEIVEYDEKNQKFENEEKKNKQNTEMETVKEGADETKEKDAIDFWVIPPRPLRTAYMEIDPEDITSLAKMIESAFSTKRQNQNKIQSRNDLVEQLQEGSLRNTGPVEVRNDDQRYFSGLTVVKTKPEPSQEDDVCDLVQVDQQQSKLMPSPSFSCPIDDLVSKKTKKKNKTSPNAFRKTQNEKFSITVNSNDNEMDSDTTSTLSVYSNESTTTNATSTRLSSQSISPSTSSSASSSSSYSQVIQLSGDPEPSGLYRASCKVNVATAESTQEYMQQNGITIPPIKLSIGIRLSKSQLEQINKTNNAAVENTSGSDHFNFNINIDLKK